MCKKLCNKLTNIFIVAESGDLDMKMNFGQEVKFHRFIYFDSELFQVTIS